MTGKRSHASKEATDPSDCCAVSLRYEWLIVNGCWHDRSQTRKLFFALPLFLVVAVSRTRLKAEGVSRGVTWLGALCLRLKAYVLEWHGWRVMFPPLGACPKKTSLACCVPAPQGVHRGMGTMSACVIAHASWNDGCQSCVITR